jgi:ribosomal subunit interface protein
MPVLIKCRSVKIGQKKMEMITRKLEGLKKFFERVDRIEVFFIGEKLRCKCEINVHAAPFFTSCSVEAEDELTAFDKALKTARRQIKGNKTKMYDRKKAGSRAKGKGGEDEEVEEEEE